MATGASDIFTQDLEDFSELVQVSSRKVASIPKIIEACPAMELPAEPIKQVSGQGLSPKREAWLLRVGQEAKVPQEVMERCVSFLQGAGGAEVKVFFDELSRRKGEVFRAFMAA